MKEEISSSIFLLNMLESMKAKAEKSEQIQEDAEPGQSIFVLPSRQQLYFEVKEGQKNQPKGQVEQDKSQNNKKSREEKSKNLINQVIKQSLRNKKIVRRSQSICVFIITILFTLLLGTENLYVFLWQYENRDIYIYLPTLIIRPIFFIVVAHQLCPYLNVKLKLFFTFDKVFLTIIAQLIGVIGYCNTYIPHATHPWFYYSLYGLYPISLFTFAGFFRVLLVCVKWNKCQIILMKLSLLIGGASYFGLSLYYTVVDVQFTGGSDPESDSNIKNLLFLYAFSGFDFYLESFSLIDGVDGTALGMMRSQLQCPEDDMEILLYGKKRKQKKPSPTPQPKPEENPKQRENLQQMGKVELKKTQSITKLQART